MCLTGTSSGAAQTVLLEIRPRAGDTLHLRLEQQTELTGTRRAGGNGSPTFATVVTKLRVYSRAIVQRSVATGSYVRAITDSIRLTTTDSDSRALGEQARRALEGRSMLLRISPDGTVALVDSTRDVSGQGFDASLMPAAFPRTAVAVGGTWTRDMPLSAGGRLGPGGRNATGWLHTRFRLDSVRNGGILAYVSMRGEMSADPDARLEYGSGPVLEKGTVVGTMLVDRARGWLTESQFTIVARSIVRAPGTSDTLMRFDTRVTQRMKTVERR